MPTEAVHQFTSYIQLHRRVRQPFHSRFRLQRIFPQPPIEMPEDIPDDGGHRDCPDCAGQAGHLAADDEYRHDQCRCDSTAFPEMRSTSTAFSTCWITMKIRSTDREAGR